jgi:hypothetical protein
LLAHPCPADAFLKYIEDTFLDTAALHDNESRVMNAKAKASLTNEQAKKTREGKKCHI